MARLARMIATTVTVASLAFPMVSAHATSPTQTERYTAGFFGDAIDSVCQTEEANPTDENLGGACFPVASGKTLTATVADDFQPGGVGYFWGFRDRFGNFTFGRSGPDPVAESIDSCTSCGNVCDDTLRIVGVPAGAVDLYVAPFGPLLGLLVCQLDDSTDTLGFGTTGSITVTQS